MQKLHLVGFTTDQKGLILSARRGSRSGSFHLPVDEALAESVEELRARQAEDQAAVDDNGDAEAVHAPRVESALPVREIQARLRQGRSVPEVARAAGVEPAWVERFATPVFAEQAQVVTKAQGLALRRARLGPSSHSIGDAVRRNLAERGVTLSPEEFASAWSTRQLADGRWAVRFSFRHRNKDQKLRFDLDDATGTVTAADRVSGQLGYVAPPPSADGTAPRPPRSARPRREDQPTAKRATVTTGFRPEPPAPKPTSRSAKERERASQAMRRAAVRGAADAERAVVRKGKEKQEAARRKEREAKAEAARRLRERQAAEKAKAAAIRVKAVAAKRAAAERDRRKAERQAAAQAKRAEAALRAAEERRTATKDAARKPAAEKVDAPRQGAAKKAAAKPSVAKPGAVKKGVAKPAPTTVAPRPAAANAAPKNAAPDKTGPAQARREQAAPEKPGPRVAAVTREASGLGVREPAAASVTPTRLPVRLREDPVAEVRPTLEPPVGRTAEVPVPSSTRAHFRAGLVERPDDGPPPRAATPGGNGVAPPRPPDRPRRTQPLRAT